MKTNEQCNNLFFEWERWAGTKPLGPPPPTRKTNTYSLFHLHSPSWGIFISVVFESPWLGRIHNIVHTERRGSGTLIKESGSPIECNKIYLRFTRDRNTSPWCAKANKNFVFLFALKRRLSRRVFLFLFSSKIFRFKTQFLQSNVLVGIDSRQLFLSWRHVYVSIVTYTYVYYKENIRAGRLSTPHSSIHFCRPRHSLEWRRDNYRFENSIHRVNAHTNSCR